jgi:SpoIID/LytB domain protein
MRKLFLLSVMICAFLGFTLLSHPVYSDQLDDLTQQINKLQQELTQSQQATAPLKSQVDTLNAQLTGIENQVAAIEADVAQKKKDIADGYQQLGKQRDQFNQAVRSYYIQSSYFSPLLVLFSSTDASYVTQILAYQQHQTNVDKTVITNTALKITDLENRQKQLETEETGLASAKSKLAVQKASLQKIIDGAVAYQSTLSSQIATLTVQQQQFIAQKQAALGLPTSAYTASGGCSSDLTNGKDPGFSPGFAFFTYGVPHRVGLSQYGAWGRAKAGQNSDSILHAYFNFDGYQTFGNDITIRVNDSNGYDQGNIIWSGSLEDYVKRVYEVPDSWTDNDSAALKAQAIAARSYVLATTNNGSSSICANQNCQVFKTDPKGGNWDSAVNATAGQAMVQGGKAIKAWFSSTAGGYFHSSSDVGWSATSWTKSGVDASGSVNSFADLNSNAYDKDSPWFYCDWGGRSQYSNTAWMQPSEVADIVNVILLAQKDSSTQDHLYQVDKTNPKGTDTWDADRVKQELRSRGVTPYNSVSSISIGADFGSGTTTSVNVSGDAGSQTFNGTEFSNFFNLRAPANIQIVGPLFNVEKR